MIDSQRVIDPERVVGRCKGPFVWGLGLMALLGCALLAPSAAADIAPRKPRPVAPSPVTAPKPVAAPKAVAAPKPVAAPEARIREDSGEAAAAPSTSAEGGNSAEAEASAAPPPAGTSASAPSGDAPGEPAAAPRPEVPASGPIVNDPKEPPKAHAGGRDVRAARASFIVAAAFLGVLAAFWMLMRWRKSRLYAQLAQMETHDKEETSGS
ncbi:MAG: hypothetical protein H6718_11325 [Polyangiaceae bacterium]|nr:hypothetical protein [Polyangiaceae bacterium]MCB9607088.1 hypothetical protein [Polyangiaceae bacterium]